MRTSAWLACGVLALSACAGRGPRPLGTMGRVGAGICPVAGGLEVVTVVDGSPADDAKLREGDVLLSYDERDLTSPENRRRLLWDIRTRPGKKLELKVKRGDAVVTAKAKPARMPFYSSDELAIPLFEEVAAGGNVTIAVVVDKIQHTQPQLFGGAAAFEAWRTGMRVQLESYFERLLLIRPLMRCGNYAVADRDKTEQVLKELGFQMSGAVSSETTRRMGQLLGASHLLFVSFTRYPGMSPGTYEDVTSARLVAVESGKVAASTSFAHDVRRQ